MTIFSLFLFNLYFCVLFLLCVVFFHLWQKHHWSGFALYWSCKNIKNAGIYSFVDKFQKLMSVFVGMTVLHQKKFKKDSHLWWNLKNKLEFILKILNFFLNSNIKRFYEIDMMRISISNNIFMKIIINKLPILCLYI